MTLTLLPSLVVERTSSCLILLPPQHTLLPLPPSPKKWTSFFSLWRTKKEGGAKPSFNSYLPTFVDPPVRFISFPPPVVLWMEMLKRVEERESTRTLYVVHTYYVRLHIYGEWENQSERIEVTSDMGNYLSYASIYKTWLQQVMSYKKLKLHWCFRPSYF